MLPTRFALLTTALVVVPALADTAMAQCTAQWSDTDPVARIIGNVSAITSFDPDGTGPTPSLLVAGGVFRVGRQENAYVAAHDGQDWTVLDSTYGFVDAFASWNGQLVAGGAFSPGVVRAWNGTTWSVLGSILGSVQAMAVYGGQLIVAGTVTSAGGVPVNGIARFDGTTWSPLGTGVQGAVHSLALFNGSLWVGGALTSAGGSPVANLAIWNGSAWTAGPVFDAPIRSMAVRNGTALTNSFLWVGGEFGNVGAVAASRVARFSPSSGLWTAVPGLPGTACRALLVRGTGLNSYELSAAVDNGGAGQRVFRLLAGVWTALGNVVDVAPADSPRGLGYHAGRYTLAQANADVGVQSFDGTAWAPVIGFGVPAVARAVTSLAGEVVLGGDFATIGGVVMNGIARRTGGSWTTIGGGLGAGARVRAIAPVGSNGLVVGGAFPAAGATAVANIARWDGASWSALGSGIAGEVHALLAQANGTVIAGGEFLTAGGSAASRVARWNGSGWAPMGQLNGTVRALAQLPNGEVVAGGDFTADGGATMLRLARWTGSAWVQLGVGCNGAVYALAVGGDGTVHVGGDFTAVGASPASRVARWNGTALTGLVLVGVNDGVRALALHPSGALLVGGAGFSFSAGPLGSWSSHLVRVDGTTLSPLDVDGVSVEALAVVGADVVVAGEFDYANGQISSNVARLQPGCPAAVAVVQSQCVAPAPQLVAASGPWLGATYRAVTGPCAPNAIAIEVFGASGVSVPLPPVLPVAQAGCTLFAAPDVTTTYVPVAGFVQSAFTLPVGPSLVGIVLHQQMIEVQFGAGGALAAVRGSNGLVLTVGTF